MPGLRGRELLRQGVNTISCELMQQAILHLAIIKIAQNSVSQCGPN